MKTRRFLVIQRSAPAECAEPPPEAMREMYAAFSAWKQKFAAEIVDMGGKLGAGGRVLRSSGVTDGPYAEAKEIVGGFMVVAADSYERALEVARECPGLVVPGASVEIREMSGP